MPYSRRLALFIPLTCAVMSQADADPWYLRAGLGWQTSDSIQISDTDCHSESPPSLFGCVTGSDGRTLGAYGDFGDSFTWTLGTGYRMTDDWRLELNYTQAAGHAFAGEANFLRVNGPQPVTGDLTTRTLLAQVFRDFDVGWSGIRPWIGLGAGWTRHAMGEMTYSFPSLGAGAVTIMPGGDRDQFVWSAGLGVAWQLDTRIALDLGWSYSDLGWMGTETGTATVIRARGPRWPVIAGTEAPVRVQGLQLGLRYQF